jgi:hypothetical protein
LSALVFAFAQPFIPSTAKQRTGSRAISVYIDNSFSLDAQGESGSLLELARKHAQDIARSYKPSDRFQLLTNDFEGRHQQLLTREQFENMLDEVKPSPVSRKLNEVIERQKDLIRQEKLDNGICYIISDFQKNTADLSSIKADTAFDLNCIHLKAEISDNLSLDSCWFESPFREKSKPDEVHFRLANSGSKRYENVPIKLIIDENERGLESISLGPDSTMNSAISFTTNKSGLSQCELRFNDYPVSFDDVFYFSYSVPDRIHVLVINGKEESQYLNQLYSANTAFELKNSSIQQVDYALLPRQQFILLNEVDAIKDHSLRFQGILSGKLRIASVSTGKYIMPYFLRKFLSDNPQVELEMEVSNKNKVMEGLRNNEVDFALVSILPTTINIEKLDLLQNKLYLVGSEKIKFKNGTKTDFTQCNSSISVRHLLNRFQLCVYWFNSRHHWLVNGIKK